MIIKYVIRAPRRNNRMIMPWQAGTACTKRSRLHASSFVPMQVQFIGNFKGLRPRNSAHRSNECTVFRPKYDFGAQCIWKKNRLCPPCGHCWTTTTVPSLHFQNIATHWRSRLKPAGAPSSYELQHFGPVWHTQKKTVRPIATRATQCIYYQYQWNAIRNITKNIIFASKNFIRG